MNAETIQSIQEYLTVSHDNQNRKLVNVEVLLKRHRPEPVIYLLKRLYKEKGKILVNLMEKEKSSFRVDEVIAAMFRIYMAIKEIEKITNREPERKEVKLICPS